ncbi:MAG: hypothetical protein D6761_03515 [Candidatus Dadabacteria bacterium]|nr:MAG: hypothetical protein D6761_03515 [Candidatus Dadabacteria bacterium]
MSGPVFTSVDAARATCNRAVYDPARRGGHYESWFQRANHPSRPLGFWVRYTIFVPADRKREPMAELWAIWFDGERRRVTAGKQEVSLEQAAFDREGFSVQIGDARLDADGLSGAVTQKGAPLRWNLTMTDGQDPLLFLPLPLYRRGIPKAKALVGRPNCLYSGTIDVDGETHQIENWRGSQNHNWGSRHTDHYAWGQVAGFDGHPDAFLEVGTARIKIGPFWTPFLTPLVLRLEGREIAINGLGRAVRNYGSFDYFDWRFRASDGDTLIEGRIHAPGDAFVALRYHNPPGGEKICLNSKIASCELIVRESGRPEMRLEAPSRAAFEILTDDTAHGLQPVV